MFSTYSVSLHSSNIYKEGIVLTCDPTLNILSKNNSNSIELHTGSVGSVAAEVVGEGGEASTVVVFESKSGEESLATSSSGVSAEIAMSSSIIGAELGIAILDLAADC